MKIDNNLQLNPITSSCLIYIEDQGPASPLLGGYVGSGVSVVRKIRKSGWGGLPAQKLFSDRCRRLIRSWAITLQSMGKENILLLTVTVPLRSNLAKTVLVGESSYVTNRLNVAISARLGVAKRIYFHVKEFTRSGGLHWHYALYVPKDLQLLFTKNWLQEVVYKILQCVCARSGVDLLAIPSSINKHYSPEDLVVEVEPLYFSIVEYFSKLYTVRKSSKGVVFTKSPYTLHDGTVLSPTSWAAASHALSRETNKRRVSLKFFVKAREEAEAVLEELKTLIGGVWKQLDHRNYTFNHISGFRTWVPVEDFNRVISIFHDVARKYGSWLQAPESRSQHWLAQSITCKFFPTGVVRIQLTHEQARAM